MHKTVHGKKLLVNLFLIAAAVLLILFVSLLTSAKISGTTIKLSHNSSVYKIIITKNIKRTTNKQAGKLVESDIRKQMVIVT